MGSLQDFLSRLRANKVMCGLAIAFAFAATVLKFPQWFKWLPPQAFDALWQAAIDTFRYGLVVVVLFVKQHGQVGDPAGKNTAVIDGVGAVTITPGVPGKIEGDAARNARGDVP